MNTRDILLLLSHHRINNGTILKLYESIQPLHTIVDVDLCSEHNLTEFEAKKIYDAIDDDLLESVTSFFEANNISFLTIEDIDYPSNLREIQDRPAVIYYRGELHVDDEVAIAIVGARKCTAYGIWATKHLVAELARMGITIVSGLAMGIDRYAHETTLKHDGRTLAVLGNGLNTVYPKSNWQLYEAIPHNGAVITEFTWAMEPKPYHFPQRNRIISGLSLGTLVIEAKEKSGTLITAGYAADQGRDVFAVPGNINSLFSKGTNRLIKDGAKVVMSVDDILEEIAQFRMLRMKTNIDSIAEKLSDQEIMLYSEICVEPRNADELAYLTKMNISEVSMLLTVLELKGVIVHLGAQRFSVV